MFLFQIGTIKRLYEPAALATTGTFLFQIGTIKSICCITYKRTTISGFYSKLVRLKVPVKTPTHTTTLSSFYSKLVRLKEMQCFSVHLTKISFYSKLVRLKAQSQQSAADALQFLFQIGTIKSHVSSPFK